MLTTCLSAQSLQKGSLHVVSVCPEPGTCGRWPERPSLILLALSTPLDHPLPRWLWVGLLSFFGSWDISKQGSKGRKRACTLGPSLLLPLDAGYPDINKPRLGCWVRTDTRPRDPCHPADGQPTTTQVGEAISNPASASRPAS